MDIDIMIAIFAGGFFGFFFGAVFVMHILSQGAKKWKAKASCKNCRYNIDGNCKIWDETSPKGICSEWRY